MPVEMTIQSPAVLAAIQEMLTQIPTLALEAMGAGAEALHRTARGRTPRGVGPGAGHLKESWSEVQMIEGGLSFENPVEYGPFLEFGLYPGQGPRTVPGPGGGYYSTQAPEGILGPMIEDDALLGDIVEAVTATIVRRVEALVHSA